MKTFIITSGQDTVKGALPYLEIIAKQNGLRLNVYREFKIARKIYERSILCN